MTLKHLILPMFLLAASSLWYCQKSPQTELNPVAQSLQTGAEKAENRGCHIPGPLFDPVCKAQIRVRCINVAPGAEVYAWEVASRWYALENDQASLFNFTLFGGPGGGFQQGVWYDLPKPVLKQSILDSYCPGNHGNQLDCIVFTGTPDYVAQWSMWVDVKSGNRITTYHMNGATGILTPVQLVFLPDPSVAYDQTDVDFLSDCSNSGAQGVQCHPTIGCAECANIINNQN